MNESQITTAAQLDAAIEEQRAAKIAALRRKATRTGYAVWIVLALVVVEIGLVLATYLVDRHVPPVAHIGILVGIASSVAVGDAARRRRAREDLGKALKSQAKRSPTAR